MDQKTFRAPLSFKTGDKGTFQAVFATLGLPDHDLDVTLPGAFGRQKVLIESWNHDLGRPPVGKGVIREQGNEAIVEGAFFLDTEAGKEHYTIARELGSDQEWSYTFQILASEPGTHAGQRVRFLKRLSVLGVGQVTRGAGVNTRTTDIKAGRGELLPFGLTPVTAQAAIFKVADPAATMAIIDAELTDRELEALEARVNARGTWPTVRDVIYADVVADYGGDHDSWWIDAMVAGSLRGYTEQAYRRQEGQAGVSPSWARAEAEIAQWAEMPVRVLRPSWG